MTDARLPFTATGHGGISRGAGAAAAAVTAPRLGLLLAGIDRLEHLRDTTQLPVTVRADLDRTIATLRDSVAAIEESRVVLAVLQRTWRYA